MPNTKINVGLRNEIIDGRPYKRIAADSTTTEMCPFCDIQMAVGVSEWVAHFKYHTGEFQYDFGLGQGNVTIYGFMCPGCYYTKLDKQHVLDHIRNEHKINGNLEHACVKFVLLREKGMLNRSYFPYFFNQISNQSPLQIKC